MHPSNGYASVSVVEAERKSPRWIFSNRRVPSGLSGTQVLARVSVRLREEVNSADGAHLHSAVLGIEGLDALVTAGRYADSR